MQNQQTTKDQSLTNEINSNKQTEQKQQSLNKQQLSDHQRQQKIQKKEEQKQQQSNQNQIDLDEVVVKKQQPQQEKFIESNLDIAQEKKKLANEQYANKNYDQAFKLYQNALQYSAVQSQQQRKFKSILYSNMGLTMMKMQNDEVAIDYLKKSLKLNQKYSKARTNLAISYENLDKIQEALQQFKKVAQQTPNDKFINNKITVLEIKVKDLQEKRKEQVLSGLKNIGNSVLGYFGMSLDNFKMQQGPGGGYNIAFKQ